MKQLISVKLLSLTKVLVGLSDKINNSLIKFTGRYGRPVSSVETSSLHHFPEALDILRYSANTQSIDGMTAPAELKALYFVTLFAPKGNIIEIGSWLGKSTVYIARALQQKNDGSLVYAVDTFAGNLGKESMYEAPLNDQETIYDRFLKNIQLAGVQKQIKALKMSSEKAAKKKNLTTAAAIFIDGSHEYQDVKDDILRWKSRVKKQGLLILHDYHPNFPGVIQAAKETLSGKAFTPLFLCDTLLVLRKN